MAKLFNYLSLLFWASLSMIFGLFLFTNGFFHQRTARLEKSNCTHLHNDLVTTSVPTECFVPQSRVIILIVDALKYEFVETFEDKASEKSFHRNKLPIIKDTLDVYPKNSKLFKFIADPPTSTMQRLKSLTTGTVPTFIDIQKNFAAESIVEDNLIFQNEKNGNVVIGDDTWIRLYPDQFLRHYTVHSFHTTDLDTVDNLVKKHIFKEIEKQDWSILVGHSLGVDHCGHKHGMHHPEMSRKLNETNLLIKEVIATINDENKDTVLFVIGDHGMTETGDHGGDSLDEIEAAMFVYSTKPLMDVKKQFNFEPKSEVNQVDIVPTVAVILGIPIPFSNIGKLIIEALPTLTSSDDITWTDFDFILHSLWRNIFQVQSYIDTYSSENYIADDERLGTLSTLFNNLYKEINEVKSPSDLKNVIKLSSTYFNEVRKMCYELWIQFDAGLMSKGLVLFFCTIFLFFLVLNGLKKKHLETILNSPMLNFVSFGVLISLKIIFFCYWWYQIENFVNISLFVCGMIPVLSFIILLIQNWDLVSMTWYEASRQRKTFTSIISRLILLATIFGVFSNSYVVEEDKILSYLLMSLLILQLYNYKFCSPADSSEKKGKNSKASTKTTLLECIWPVGVCFLIRFSKIFWRLREEQKYKKDGSVEVDEFVVGKVGSILSKNTEWALVMSSIVSIAFYVSIVKRWLQHCGNFSGFSLNITSLSFSFHVILVSISSYWILKINEQSKLILSLSKHINYIPLLIYVLFIVSLILLFYKPLTVFLIPTQKEGISITEDINSIPKLYERVKNFIYKKNTDDENETPVVCGLGTVYSACYILISVFFSLLFSLLLGFFLAPSVMLMNMICIGLLHLSTSERLKKSATIEELVAVPNSILLTWFLIAEYFFFASGHQTSFSTIHWDSAFIGLDNTLELNSVRAILIGINTFGSYIIMGLTLPLLVIVPFTYILIFPSHVKNQKLKSLDNLKSGELFLFENNDIIFSEIFSVAGRYIMFHGFRVFACMLASTIHSRHLMVWKIFAPKLIFEGLSFLVTVLSVFVSILLLMRIENQIEKFISKFGKKKKVK